MPVRNSVSCQRLYLIVSCRGHLHRRELEAWFRHRGLSNFGQFGMSQTKVGHRDRRWLTNFRFVQRACTPPQFSELPFVEAFVNPAAQNLITWDSSLHDCVCPTSTPNPNKYSRMAFRPRSDESTLSVFSRPTFMSTETKDSTFQQSCEKFFHHPRRLDPGQSFIEPVMFEDQVFMINAKTVEYRGVEVVDADPVFHGMVAELVGSTVNGSTLHTTPR